MTLLDAIQIVCVIGAIVRIIGVMLVSFGL